VAGGERCCADVEGQLGAMGKGMSRLGGHGQFKVGCVVPPNPNGILPEGRMGVDACELVRDCMGACKGAFGMCGMLLAWRGSHGTPLSGLGKSRWAKWGCAHVQRVTKLSQLPSRKADHVATIMVALE
jgi:hypothetical protein